MGATSSKETKSDTHSIPNKNEEQKDKKVDLHEINARVDRVNFDGVNKTQIEILKHATKNLFTAKNFEEVIKKAHESKAHMQSMGLFKTIAIYIDTSTGPKCSKNGYEVTFKVTELNTFFLEVSGGESSQLTKNEGVLTVGAFIPNMRGKGEMIKGQYSYGSKRTNALRCTLSKPFMLNGNPVGSFSLFSNSSEWPMSGYKVQDTGCMFDLAMSSNNRIGHNLQYELDWRHLIPGDRYSSFEAVEGVGHKLKSCLRHILTREGRDSSVFPNNGSLFKLTTEIAGFSGNLGYVKNEMNFQFNYPVYKKDIIFQLGLNAGQLINLGGEVCLADKFYLGGPQTVRGFEARSIGPLKDGNYLGAKMYYAGGLHIYTPLPFQNTISLYFLNKLKLNNLGDIMRMHLWINAGSIGNFKMRDLNDFISNQMNIIRMSTGIGLSIRLGQMLKGEINICLPFLSHNTDKLSSPIQIGVGMQFL